MKILHTADWHLGERQGPVANGVNLRAKDTEDCVYYMLGRAEKEQPELTLISGDIFDREGTYSKVCLPEEEFAYRAIKELAACSGKVVVLAGTPNHDGEAHLRALKTFLEDIKNVYIVTEPQVLQFDEADIVCIPAFNYQYFRTKHPDVPKDEENIVITTELAKMVVGMKALCRTDRPSVLMAHYTVTGANLESSQAVFYTNLEPIITKDSLEAAGYTLGALGHVHRPQEVFPGVFYSGAINTIKFSDEDQERGFYIHEIKDNTLIGSEFVPAPYRRMVTLNFSDSDIKLMNEGGLESVADISWREDEKIKNKIVRVRFSASEQNFKAFSEKLLKEKLYDDGAFYVWNVERVKEQVALPEEHGLDKYDPLESLKRYLGSQAISEGDINEAKVRGERIIQEVESRKDTIHSRGALMPLSIEVENYRTYVKENFDFTTVKFCSINGANGVGKSSLFMDAIIDCLYGDSREGKDSSTENGKTPWLRAEDGVRSGYIAFTFSLGNKMYRVLRKGTRSGTGSLTLSENIEGEWIKRSSEKKIETQKQITELLGMDASTFKTVALIMQDQYGLFLEADKDKRADILGDILGLGIYAEMEKAAEAERSLWSFKNSSLQTMIDSNKEKIAEYGDIEGKLSDIEEKLRDAEKTLKDKEHDKESVALKLKIAEKARERVEELIRERDSLKTELNAKENEKTAVFNNITSLKLFLSDKDEILEKNRHFEDARKAIEKYKEKYLEYIDIGKDIRSVNETIKKQNFDIASDKKKLDEETSRLTEYNEILEKAEEEKETISVLKKYHDEFLVMEKTKAEYENLASELRLAETKLDGVLNEKNYAIEALRAEENILRDDAALLENSDCIDPERAKCKFLKKAVASGEALSRMEKRYKDAEESFAETIRSAEKDIESKKRQLESLEYKNEAYKELKNKSEEYIRFKESYDSKAGIMAERAALLRIIEMSESSLTQKQEELRGLEKRLIQLHEREKALEGDYKEYLRSESLQKELETKHEKALVIPAKEDNLKSAESRFEILGTEIEGLERRIADKSVAIEEERVFQDNLKDLEYKYHSVMEAYDSAKGQVDDCLKHKGAYEEKLKTVEDLNLKTLELTEKLLEAAKETTLYALLKKAFGRDGIPRLIIGDVVPVLKDKANDILSSMTDGAMSIDIKLERSLRNDKKRLKESLDIFIDDRGKILPYKSKSGGEKVRASLSMIIALAELKSQAADIRTGFLFIDEAPFLDGAGVQAYVDALVKIRERYPDMTIMAITHDPVFKDRFTESVTVYKDDNGSHVLKD